MAAVMANENFERVARFTMAQEGGDRVSDHAADPGGLTKYGISQRAFLDLDIRSLTEEQALTLYRQHYWDKVQGDALPWPLDLALFDYAFNSGPGQAVKDLQRALGTTPDGAIGPVTRAALDRHDPVAVARDLNARRLFFLGKLSTWPTFGLGWARRVLALQAEIGSDRSPSPSSNQWSTS